MPVRNRIIAATLALSAVAACNRTAPTGDAALQRDLDLAKGQGLELAPQGGTQLVSANELLPAGSRRTTSAAPRHVAHATPAAPRAVVAQSQAVTPAPAPSAPTHDSAVAPAPAMPRPSSQGAMNPPPPGGYKTMGDIIRHAPFPINP